MLFGFGQLVIAVHQQERLTSVQPLVEIARDGTGGHAAYLALDGAHQRLGRVYPLGRSAIAHVEVGEVQVDGHQPVEQGQGGSDRFVRLGVKGCALFLSQPFSGALLNGDPFLDTHRAVFIREFGFFGVQALLHLVFGLLEADVPQAPQCDCHERRRPPAAGQP